MTNDENSNKEINIQHKLPFAAVPNYIAQSNISSDALATITLIASFPDNFKIHPTYIMKLRGYGEHTWRKVSKELRDLNLLTLHKGGNSCSGSYYTFNCWNNQNIHEIKNSDTEPRRRNSTSRENSPTRRNSTSRDSTPTRRSTETSIFNPLNKKYIDLDLNKEINNNTDDEIFIELKKFNINEFSARSLIKKYGEELVLEKINLAKSQKNEVGAGWIIDALRKNYTPPVEKKIENSEERWKRLEEEKRKEESEHQKESEEEAKKHRQEHPEMYNADGSSKLRIVPGEMRKQIAEATKLLRLENK